LSTRIKHLKFISIITSFFVAVGLMFHQSAPAQAYQTDPLWEVRSVDTMKTSRDMARSQSKNPAFDAEIDKEMSQIKHLGANYVAIDTPYDDEFLPFLKKWVASARKYNLHVWFRGSFSGYEGWFG
jgi:hypothetical protein